MHTDLLPLLTRIDQLERSNRRARRGVAVAVLAALTIPALAFVTQPGSQVQAPKSALEVIRGSGFEVVDAAGKVRARLGIDKDGAPDLRLFDGREKVRIRVGIHKDTDPIITLVDDDDKNRIAMVYDSNPHFVMSRPGGKPVIHMTAASQGDASLLFTHIDGRHNSAIGLRANGDAILIQEKSPPAEDKGK